MPSNDASANKSNRHSFCEYKPFSTRKSDLQKLKFFAPTAYKSIQDKCNPLTNSNDNLSAPDGQFNLLPLIGESQVVAYQNASGAVNDLPANGVNGTHCATDQKASQDPNVECK